MEPKLNNGADKLSVFTVWFLSVAGETGLVFKLMCELLALLMLAQSNRIDEQPVL